MALGLHPVFVVQPGRGNHVDEELRAVRVRARVGHGQNTRDCVPDHAVGPLVAEFPPVDGFPPYAAAVGEVAPPGSRRLSESPVRV